MADQLNYTVTTGSDWVAQLVFQNDDGTPMNFTGCQAHLMVRAFPQSTVVLFDLSTAAGTMTLTPYPAQLNWDVPASQTSTFTPNPGPNFPLSQSSTGAFFGYYDLMVKSPNGEIIQYLSGQILLQIGITQPF